MKKFGAGCGKGLFFSSLWFDAVGNGEAMTWGRGLSGALGHGNESSWNLPNPVKSLQGIKISSAAAGWNHTAFVTGLLGPILSRQCTSS